VQAIINRWVAATFFLLSLAFSAALALLTPPFQVPDERAHYFYARAISFGSILPSEFSNGAVGALMPLSEETFAVSFRQIQSDRRLRVSAALLDAARALPKNGEVGIVSYRSSAIYKPFAYVVSGVVLAIADALHLDRLATFFAGRLANAALYATVGALALVLIPSGRLALAAILLLPMAASLAGSYSADAFAISVAALCSAVLAAEFQLNRPRTWVLATSALMVFALATTKIPLIILLLPLAVLAWRRSWVAGISVVILVLVPLALWQIHFVWTEAQAQRLAAIGIYPSRQLAALLGDPLRVLPIAYVTLTTMVPQYTAQLVGILGWLDLPLSRWLYPTALALLGLAIVSALLDRPSEPMLLRWRLVFLASAILGCALVFGALYLSWTKTGETIVAGVQGRYFLPFAAPFVIAIAGLWGAGGRLAALLGVVAVATLYAIGMPDVIVAIVGRYYLSPT
jgi:uncharacterized membrane protein